MKKLLYTLTLIAMISSSCRNLEKLVDRGDYDGAIIYAADKLSGKKNKKTKHVQGLEEAFARINQKDLDNIAFLDGHNNPENWAAIERLADKIANRQSHVEPLTPLVSKEGYVAHFDFVDTYAIKTKAIAGAADYYYNSGKALLQRTADTGDKKYARAAYQDFEKVINRLYDYKDTHSLLRTAEEAGIVHIKVEVINNSRSYVPAEINDRLHALNVNNLNDSWKKFYLKDIPSLSFDSKAILELNEISLSPERESISYHTDEKRVKDGYRYIKNKKGEIKKDSTGKKLKEEKYKIVYADVTETYREKAAYVSGYMKIYDLRTETVLSAKPLSVEAIFKDYASSYRGDRRAVCDKDHNRLKAHSAPFPHDFDIIGDATEKLKASFLAAVNYADI